MSIINTKKLTKQNKKFTNSKNFEMDFFPSFIKSFKSNLVKLSGFWHSVDNLKDILAVNNKKISKEKYMLLTNYSFFSSILNKNNESFTRWFVGDGTDYPSNLDSKFQLILKNLVIQKIKTKEIKKIYLIKPISENNLKNLIEEKCLEKKNLSTYLTQIKIICSIDSL